MKTAPLLNLRTYSPEAERAGFRVPAPGWYNSGRHSSRWLHWFTNAFQMGTGAAHPPTRDDHERR